jgi:Tfp pilus assembly protein PilX
MDSSKIPAQNEQGFVLVLALFMLVVCTIIGIAAMNTIITEIDIAGNEKVHKETSYQAEAGYAAPVAALYEKNAYGTWADNEKFADLGSNEYVQMLDGAFLLEGRDDSPLYSGKWDKNNQAIDNVDDAPDISIRIKNKFNLDMDVDKVDVRYIAGGGVEFASGAEGVGVGTHRIIYNIDAIGTVSAWDTAGNKFLRSLRLTDGSINPATPLAEVVVGYGYVPW